MTFFRNEPITDVVRRLSLSANGEAGISISLKRTILF